MLKIINRLKIIGIGSLCLFLLGCSEESFLVKDEVSNVAIEDAGLKKGALEEDTDIVQEEESDTVQEEESDTVQKKTSNVVPIEETTVKEIVIHICGAVNQPGVYHLKEKQRLYEGINKAGGFREDADEDHLNQALILEDGMKIVVPTKEETARLKKAEEDAEAADESFVQKGSSQFEENQGNMEARVNLNTADEKLLCTLPGIGESRAKSIVAYRNEHGPYKKPEDVMKVSGIKEAAFAKIKDYITVSD